MHIKAEGKEGEEQQEGHQLLNVSMLQGDALLNNRAYIDGCLTVTAFKADKYLRGIKMVRNGIRINCNAGAVRTNKLGSFRSLNMWYIPNGIANIFLMHELEKHYMITYDSALSPLINLEMQHDGKECSNLDEKSLLLLCPCGRATRIC